MESVCRVTLVVGCANAFRSNAVIFWTRIAASSSLIASAFTVPSRLCELCVVLEGGSGEGRVPEVALSWAGRGVDGKSGDLV